jgi:hypothetical protein
VTNCLHVTSELCNVAMLVTTDLQPVKYPYLRLVSVEQISCFSASLIVATKQA